MSAPQRPTKVVECFKAACTWKVDADEPAEGTLYYELNKQRTRFEAGGITTVTRCDLGVHAFQASKAAPPEARLHEEPMMTFAPPEDASFNGVEEVDGSECQKWSFPQVGKAFTTDVEVWLRVPAEEDAAAVPVQYRMTAPTHTTELLLKDVQPLDAHDDFLFAIEVCIPSEKPPTVAVRGALTDADGDTLYGIAVSAAHTDGSKPEWTTRTAAQSNGDGVFELLLTPSVAWTVTVHGGPKYSVHTVEVTPADDGIAVGGAADAILQLSAEEAEARAAEKAAKEAEAKKAAEEAAEAEAAAAAAAAAAKAAAEKAAADQAAAEAAAAERVAADEAAAEAAAKEAAAQKAAAEAAKKEAEAKEAAAKLMAKKLTCTAEKYSTGRSSLFSNWKKRVFKAHGASVQYMEKEGSAALGTIAITPQTKIHGDVTKQMHPQASEPARDALIEFQDNGKALKLLIRFASVDEKREWVEHLNFIRQAVFDQQAAKK